MVVAGTSLRGRVPASQATMLLAPLCASNSKVEGGSHRSIDTYRRYFGYFMQFATEQVGGSVLITHFTPELCRGYQYFMASKDRQPGSLRVRLAVLGSFGSGPSSTAGSRKIPWISSRYRPRRVGFRVYRSGKPWRSSSRAARACEIGPCPR